MANVLVTGRSDPAILDEVREALVHFVRRLIPDGLSTGTSGNLSVRTGTEVAITPSGMTYDAMGPQDISIVSPDGVPRAGSRRPSSELPMHLAIYGATRARAIVHTHSPYATAVACVSNELPAVHYMILALGGPIRVAPYTTFGTDDLARATLAALADRRAALLENHGAVTYGRSLEQAYERAQLLEWLAHVYATARAIGAPRILTSAELAQVGERSRRAYPAVG